MITPKTGRRTALAAAGLASIAVAVPAANAQTVPTTAKFAASGGKTSLKLDKKTAKKLKKAGIKVSRSSGAGKVSGGFSFKITGGSADPTTFAGTVRHSGGITFKKGRRKVTIKSFVAKIGKKSTLSGKVGKKTVSFGTIGKGKLTRTGFDSKLSGATVSLSKSGAKALNKALKVKTFKTKTKLGKATVSGVFAQALISSGTATVQFAAQTAAALGAQGVTLSPVPPATQTGLTFSFPISGGVVGLGRPAAAAQTYLGPGAESIIALSGGILVKKGSTALPVSGITFELGTPRPLIRVAKPLPLVFADLSGSVTPSVNAATKTFTLAGAVIKQSPESAVALGAALNIQAPAGTVLGVGGFTLNAK